MNESTMNNSNNQQQILSSQVNEMVTVISDNLQNVSTVSGGNSTANNNPQTAPRMLPFLYIQKPANIRVSQTGIPVTSPNSPMMLPVLKSTVVGKNAQFIPNLNPKVPIVTPASSLSPGAPQPVKIASPNPSHFVIQAQRANNSTPIHPNALHVPVTMTNSNINKPTIAYLGALFKQSKIPEQQQLVVPASPINTSLVQNPKLLLTSLPVLPKLAPAPTTMIPSSISTSKMTSLLVPVTIPTQTKPATINLKIANSPIQASIESIKTPISVLMDPKPPCDDHLLLTPPPALQTLTLQNISNIENQIDNIPTSIYQEVNITSTSSFQKEGQKNSQSGENNETKNFIESQKSNDDSFNEDNKSNETNISKNFEDDVEEEEIIEDEEIEEEIDEDDVEMEEEEDEDDEITLIKINPREENKSLSPVPLDDVKIEIIKTDTKLDKTNEMLSENFDPKKVLVWKDGIGALPGSNLKFRVNEFDMIEMVENESLSQIEKINSPDNKEQSDLNETENLNEDEKETENKSNGEEFYCCESCGCYGLVSEFLSSQFCSHSCSAAFASKKAAQIKREQDMLQYKLKKRKKKRLNSLKIEESPKEKQPKLDLNEPELIDLNDTEEYLEENIETEISPQLNSTVLEAEKSPVISDADDESQPIEILYNDSKKIPWQTGKNGFSWNKYLDFCKGKAAPTKLFKDPFPYMKNLFKVGMKMEGIDPEHPSYFCVLTVCDIRGYRIQLHFDGYSNNHNFWVNADSMDIFPAGWCERNNRKLHPPRGYSPLPFNWGSYLKHCKAQTAPRNLFANKTASTICPNGFRVGMKLEAVDRKNSTLICVATVADLLFNRLLVHFDNWDHVYDYWVEPTSSYIHPVGWCEKNGHTLTPPKNFKGTFAWENYMKETNSVPAPVRAFKQRPPSGFRPGMRLECVDKRVPSLIRVATVDEIVDHQLKIKFDGWDDQYSYLIDDDSPDIHPVGWCKKTGYPLEPPLTVPDLTESSCLTPGCKGLGHIKGAKYDNHQTLSTCPYSLQNLFKERAIPDRVLKKFIDTEIKEENKDKSKIEKNPVGRPPKLKRTESCDEKNYPEPEIKLEENDVENNKKKRKLEDMISNKKNNCIQICNEIHGAIMNPGYDPNPYVLSPPLWRKHSSYLNTYVSSVFKSNPNPSLWTQEQVIHFVNEIPGCGQLSDTFKDQEIDGEALLLLAQSDLVHILGLKLGPALKLYNSIVLLRQKAIAIS